MMTSETYDRVRRPTQPGPPLPSWSAADQECYLQYDEDWPNMPDFGDHVDNGIFSQILEMDESQEDRDFSEPLVLNFFEQAEETFGKMEEAL
jgi:hypothetical protein